jgi:hypothetical protein
MDADSRVSLCCFRVVRYAAVVETVTHGPKRVTVKFKQYDATQVIPTLASLFLQCSV